MGRGRITNEKTAQGYLSSAMGVHPKQVAEYNEMYKRHGVSGVEHTPDGRLLISSRKGRAEAMKLRGLQDNDAGYGDHAGS